MDYYVLKDKDRQGITNWYRARQNIFILFCYEALLFGIELTFLEPTEYFYYKDVLNVKLPIVCYSLSLAVSVWSCVMASIFTSHVIKRYQMYTCAMILLSFASTLGHCLYFATRSPVVAIMGRFLAGFGKASNIVATIFVKHLYPEDELFDKMATLTNFVTIGTIIGPSLTYLFLQIDFNIGTLNINYANSTGFYMAICKLILFLCCYFFMHDIPLQKERERFSYSPRGLFEKIFCCCKAEEDADENFIQKFDAEEEFIKEDEDVLREKQKTKIPLKFALHETIKRGDVLAILIAVFVHGLTFQIINSLLPVESSKYLNWNIKQIAGLCLGNAVLGTIASLIMAILFASSTHYLNLIGGMVFDIFSLVLLGTLPHYATKMAAADVLFCFMSFFNVLSSCLIGLSARMLLSHLTNQKLKSFTDVLRTFVMEVSYFFGSLLTMMVTLNLTASLWVGLIITIITLIYFVFRLKHIWE